MTLVLLMMLSCGDKDDTGTDGDADTDTDSDSDTDTDTDADPSAVWERVDPSHCDAVPGFEGVSGAASYFVGEYRPSGGPTQGKETWALYANPAWEAAGGADCIVVWSVTASSTGTGSCGSCDFGISVQAQLDKTASTCAEDLYEGDETFEVDYAVDEREDGTAEWYFASSGTRIGSGLVETGGVSFITDPSCTWF